MTVPKRIQRRRTKGWRMPENARYVGRGSAFGNDYRVGIDGDAATCVRLFAESFAPYRHGCDDALDKFYLSMANIEHAQADLRGHDVACWCGLCPAHQDGLPLSVKCSDCPPCHGDVLLELANPRP